MTKRIQVGIYLDSKVYQQFRDRCFKEGKIVSRQIELYMIAALR